MLGRNDWSEKVTLRAFAKQIGISATFVSGMENNEKAAPSGEVLKKHS